MKNERGGPSGALPSSKSRRGSAVSDSARRRTPETPPLEALGARFEEEAGDSDRCDICLVCGDGGEIRQPLNLQELLDASG